MLTKQLVDPSYKCIRLMDYFCSIPVSLDLKTGRLSYEGRLKTKIIHNTLFLLGILKTFHIVYALAVLVMDYESDSFATIILTFSWLSLFGTSMYWGYELFHRGLQDTIVLFNSMEFDSAGPSDSFVWTLRSRKDLNDAINWGKANMRLILSFNLQEFMCFMTPFAVKMFPPLYWLLMMVFPHWSIFATSLVLASEESSWTWTSGVCVVFEILATFYMESNILFLFFFQLALQIIGFSGANRQIRDVTRFNAGKTPVTLETIDKQIRILKDFYVLMSLVNVLFSNIIFTGKVMALSCSILGTYYVLTSYSESLVFTVFFTFLSVDAIIFYIASCHFLFRIPGMFATRKELVRAMLDKKENKVTSWEQEVRKCSISAMPEVGCRDGSFRTMESISTLVFIDFYLNQVISLLLF